MAIINGKVYDWNSITIKAKGFDGIEPIEISYDDEQEHEPIYGKKGKIRGFGTGNKKNSVKISMLREDFDAICDAMVKAGVKNFYSYLWPKITVSYADEGKPTRTDVITKFKPSKRSFKAAQNDKSMKVDLDGMAYGSIKINGLDA